MTLRSNLFILFVSFASLAFGQTVIDSTFSIDFPGKADTTTFEESNVVAKTWAYNTHKESYVFLRMTLLTNGKELKPNPTDSNHLFDIYTQDIQNQIASMKRKGFEFTDSTKIHIQNYIGYDLKYVNSTSATQSAESVLLFLNGIRYAAVYSKVSEFNEENKDKFFRSIKISNPEAIQQITKSNQTETSGMNPSFFKLGLYLIIIIVAVIMFKQKSKNNPQLGINLKRVICPVCNTKQPIIRMPDSKEQALYGGTTCPNCHTKLDKYGNIIT